MKSFSDLKLDFLKIGEIANNKHEIDSFWVSENCSAYARISSLMVIDVIDAIAFESDGKDECKKCCLSFYVLFMKS